HEPRCEQSYHVLLRDPRALHSFPTRRSADLNLARALAPWGINRDRVPVAFNIFMHVAVGAEGRIAVLPPLSRAGDHVRLRAEMPLVVAMTACSAGQSNNFSYKPIDFRVERASDRAKA